MSSRGSLHRRSARSGNCLFGELSVGEVSVGELSSRGTVCIPIYIDSFVDLLKESGYNKALTKVSAEDQENLRIFYYGFVQWGIGDYNLLYTLIKNICFLQQSVVHTQMNELPSVRVLYSETFSIKKCSQYSKKNYLKLFKKF